MVVAILTVVRPAFATDPKQITMSLKPHGKVMIEMAGTGMITIDWGDGSTNETYELLAYSKEQWYKDWQKYTYNHPYSGKSTYTITITGENITHLECVNIGLTSLDVSKNTTLTNLWCDNNLLKNLDVSKNTALLNLYCAENQLTSLDLTKNLTLTELWCYYNLLTNLDVSNNATLKGLDCQKNQLSTVALNALFETLHGNTIPKEKRICIRDNLGTDSCNQSIAIGKGWTVICPAWGDEDTIFVTVENMPLFKGKSPEEGFREYINRKTIYPRIAERNGIEGSVLVEFTINEKGRVVDIKVIQGAHPLLDAEALRVVNSSPKWTPAMHRGKKVKVKYSFPFVFRLR
jgi:TonB family protein